MSADRHPPELDRLADEDLLTLVERGDVDALEQVELRRPDAPDTATLGIESALADSIREELGSLPAEQHGCSSSPTTGASPTTRSPRC